MSSPRITERKIAQPQPQQAGVPGALHAAAAAAAAVVQDQLGGAQAPAAAFAEPRAQAVVDKLGGAAAAAAAAPAQAAAAPLLDERENAQFSQQLGRDIVGRERSDEQIEADIQQFLARGGDLQAVWLDGQNYPNLLLALQRGRIKLAEALVSKFACNMTEEREGLNIFSAVASSQEQFDKVAAIQKLIQLRAPLIDREGSTLLHDRLNIVTDILFEAVLEFGQVRALINTRDGGGYAPLQRAVQKADNLHKIRILIRCGADTTLPGPNNATLFDLVEASDLEPLQKIAIREALAPLVQVVPVKDEIAAEEEQQDAPT